ncbi:MAG: head-tail adaptor protein [Sphingobium limneticum]
MTGIAAGDLEWVVAIMRAPDTDDGLSSVPGEFSEIGQRWAKKTDIKDGERLRAGENAQDLTSRFLFFSDELTRTITAKDALICDGATHYVIGSKSWGDRNVGIEVTCSSRPDMRPS